ncbi:peptidyl-prolyl cis-trans isomerase FKBP19, chloroplastic isoform X1 [Physcomitrium patens]|uniref:peptidylprolyl isomerase n=1 Tax=Physcomitrium patens TaxID=3218 RepID=A0A2K1J894_PHYPA|nr:peptidyl-prolyl cis-trans isomerase FKBP19, chloroplastic-like [Physcomitrium patens]PNR37739.1 hypothetical protein PHYPA_020848 [Physcomitrium patens]|eukprot:XP_024397791.1 peptidyl-prolyl cis-trans isomerase FKBP19, chloroplastic-like [Physcomitrella patens]
MAAISSLHSLPCARTPSLAAYSSSRQTWHLSPGQPFIKKQRKGEMFIRASAINEDSSRTSDETLEPASWSKTSRRQIVSFPAASICAYLFSTLAYERKAVGSDYADMPALRGKDYGKTKMKYPDYIETESGLQYKDLRIGTGSAPNVGNLVVVDWDGYTIGYYGRIFEARNKAKGGSFEGDEKNFFRFKLGNSEVIPAFDEAVATMKVGGIRRLIVPPELGYPNNDYNQKGPRPTTFSGQRALDFVLRNQGLIDKTLLFDIELIKVVN